MRSANYIKHITLNNGTLVNSVLDSEISLDGDNNILFLARTYSPYYQADTNYLIPKSKNELKELTLDKYKVRYYTDFDKYHRLWSSSLMDMSKADTYRSYKTEISLEKYLSVVKNH